MYDAEIGLDKGDSINLKLAGGSVFIWNDNGVVSISVQFDVDILQVYLDDETMEVLGVTSPMERIRIPVQSWKSMLMSLATKHARQPGGSDE